jgi:hypothetical protein
MFGGSDSFNQATFSRVIEQTYRHSPADDRPAIVARTLRDLHTFLWSDVDYLEFASIVKKYPIRERLEVSVVDHRGTILNYDQGAGFDVAVCGHSALSTVIVQLKHIGYIEIYHRTSPDSFTREDIYFNKNIRLEDKLTPPFVHLLSVFDGCRFSTLEVLWKYYCAAGACRSKAITVASRKISALSPSVNSEGQRVNSEDRNDNDEDCESFREELSKDNIDLFAGIVDSFYKAGLIKHYTSFTQIDGYLVERTDIRLMYDTMVEIFPFVHSVLLTAMTRPGTVTSVLTSEFAILGDTENDVCPDSAADGEVCLEDKENNSEDEHKRPMIADTDINLTKHQRDSIGYATAKHKANTSSQRSESLSLNLD